MRYRNWFLCALTAIGLVSCAHEGPPLRRGPTTVEYTGRPYAVASDGQRVTGRVCGNDVNYQVVRRGPNEVRISGYIGTNLPSELTIHNRPNGQQQIVGYLGPGAGRSAVDLQVEPGRLSGRVGFREVDLRASGNALVGPIAIAGSDTRVEGVLRGRDNLLRMDPAAEAVIVPNLLTCYIAPVGTFGRASPLDVTVGGPVGDLPRASSSVYHD